MVEIAKLYLGLLRKYNIDLRPSDIIDRKKDHIDLAFKSAISSQQQDPRFHYEPLFTTHPRPENTLDGYFLGTPYKYPIWVSSMTGGTGKAKSINQNLARACKEFGLGMGLGSCRKILTSDEFIDDFAMRPYIGDRPMYANLGIVQLIELVQQNKLSLISELIKKLEADGIIIHINPIQEWIQPEGDRIYDISPLVAIKRLLEDGSLKVIIKEVGQGMGPKSIGVLMSLPLAAIEFGAFGGTNFAKLESLRDNNDHYNQVDRQLQDIDPLCYVGHTPSEMVRSIIDVSSHQKIACNEFIISGGVAHYLDGYFYNETLPFNSVYGQAANFLKHAMISYDALEDYVSKQTQGYTFAMRYLKVKPEYLSQ